ncbi:MAG: ATP-binding protein, partial [Synergistaceae bacterium]|nr:ATP-binding protein [Synergistaceae bacterium]
MNDGAGTVRITQRERDAIVKSLSAGVVPTIGLQHIQVDRKDEIMAMIGDLERISEGGASVRFVIGKFGTGKSFFLNLTKAVAIAEGFVVMHADVAPKRRLASTTGYARNLYTELVAGMSIKAKPEGGAIEFVLERWIKTLSDRHLDGEKLLSAVKVGLNPLRDMVGGFHFAAAVTKCCEAYVAGDEEMFGSAIRWLAGGFGKLTDAKNELGIDSFIGDKDIYDCLKLWAVFTRIAGFSGMLVLLDEMGALAQGIGNRAARDSNYEVILQILNECLQGRTSGIGFLFAGADFFLDDHDNGLMSNGALESRLAPNPFARKGLKDFSTPVMRLGEFSPEDLYLLLENIRNVFALGDKSEYLIPDEAIHSFMNLCAWSLGAKFYRTPREAVKLFTGFLSVLQQNAHVGWRSLLDETVIEKVGEDAADEPVYDNEEITELGEVSPEEGNELPESVMATDLCPLPETEAETESIEAPKRGQDRNAAAEPETVAVPTRPEPTFTIDPDVLEPIFEPDMIFEFERDAKTAFDPEPKFEPAEKADEDDEDFEFGFEGELASRPPEFEMDQSPVLYAVKPNPVVYDPNILYILPDSGSSREVSLRLLRTETRKESVSAPVYDALPQGEEDMRAGRALYGNENDLKVYLPNAISKNPLIGVERISPSVLNDLVRMSGKILINAYNNYLPNGYEKLLLTVTLANIAKRWVSDDENKFWNFIGR